MNMARKLLSLLSLIENTQAGARSKSASGGDARARATRGRERAASTSRTDGGRVEPAHEASMGRSNPTAPACSPTPAIQSIVRWRGSTRQAGGPRRRDHMGLQPPDGPVDDQIERDIPTSDAALDDPVCFVSLPIDRPHTMTCLSLHPPTPKHRSGREGGWSVQDRQTSARRFVVGS